MPGGAAVLRKIINDLQLGTPDYATMSLALADELHRQLPRSQPMMVALGELVSIQFEAVGAGGYDLYDVRFTHGRAEFPIDLTPDGRLEDLGFNPSGDETQGAVEACTLEATLDSSHQTVPIRISLVNRSGTDLKLFELDNSGNRVAQGTLHQDDRTRRLLTYVHRPLVITNESGECREIVLPGLATRVHVIEPQGFATPKRSTQLAGSEQMLPQYIDRIRTYAPLYEQMTPAAALATRETLPRQSAVLAKLGALEAMSFRGVSETGSDLYTVRFANGSTEWQIRMAAEGRIAEVALRPQPRQ